jgi:RimJ/RimL family protein N-acetyltransferase
MSAALIVPTLTTGPFRLRPFTLADTEMVREASSDAYIPLITTVPAAYTDEEGRRFIERQWSEAEQGTGYSFAIADAGTDRAVGQVVLLLKDISMGRASVGYYVVSSARGSQAAAFAVQGLVRWAHPELGVPRLQLYVEPWNAASIRTAEKAGFQPEGLLRSWQEIGGKRKDVYMYARLSADPIPPIP